MVNGVQRKYKEEKDRKKIETKDRNQKQKDKIENLLDTQQILKRRLQRIILVRTHLILRNLTIKRIIKRKSRLLNST